MLLARQAKRGVRRRGKNPDPYPFHRKGTFKEYEIKMGPSLDRMKLMWTTGTPDDAKHIAKVYAKAYPSNYISVKKKS